MTAITRTSRHRLAAVALAALATMGTAATATASPGRTGAYGSDATSSSVLSGFLPDARAVSRLVGVDLSVNRTIGNLATVDTPIRPARCLSAYMPVQAATYAGVSPMAVAGQSLEGPRAAVLQNVVQLPSKADTLDLVKSTANAWADCGGVTVSETTTTQAWQLDKPRINDDHTIVTIAQHATNSGATCERAIAAQRDLFFDVMACTASGSTVGTAASIVAAISRNALTQST